MCLRGQLSPYLSMTLFIGNSMLLRGASHVYSLFALRADGNSMLLRGASHVYSLFALRADGNSMLLRG